MRLGILMKTIGTRSGCGCHRSRPGVTSHQNSCRQRSRILAAWLPREWWGDVPAPVCFSSEGAVRGVAGEFLMGELPEEPGEVFIEGVPVGQVGGFTSAGTSAVQASPSPGAGRGEPVFDELVSAYHAMGGVTGFRHG